MRDVKLTAWCWPRTSSRHSCCILRRWGYTEGKNNIRHCRSGTRFLRRRSRSLRGSNEPDPHSSKIPKGHTSIRRSRGGSTFGWDRRSNIDRSTSCPSGARALRRSRRSRDPPHRARIRRPNRADSIATGSA